MLLIAGTLTSAAAETIDHVHDQMAGPRVTVGWGHPEPAVVPLTASVAGDVDGVTSTIRQHFHDVLIGAIPPEPPRLADVDPVEWRGVGPYGHGGAGMTGGSPFGRPLALRASSRDGLELDQLPVTIGPWFDGFPPGLALRVFLQGDVAQVVEVTTTDFVTPGPPDVFARALHEPMPIRDLEMARARHHLEWMGDALRMAGVDRLAMRAYRLSAAIGPGESDILERFMTAARRSLLGPMTLRGVGILPQDVDVENLGPVARAVGRRHDRRSSEQAYRELDFETLTHEEGDAWGRFAQRAAEATQAVDLAGRAGDRRAFGNGEVEAPDGLHRAGEPDPAGILVPTLATVLTGMEWGDLVSTVQSLDIDMESVSVGSPAA